MIEWSETHLSIKSTLRKFCESEIKPRLHAIEHEGEPPYEVLRKLVATFGIDEMAKAQFAQRIEKEKKRASGELPEAGPKKEGPNPAAAMETAMRMIPIIELSRLSPGMVTALGVSMGLTANAIMSKGTIRQKERWALDLLTLAKVGAWAITGPGSGSMPSAR